MAIVPANRPIGGPTQSPTAQAIVDEGLRTYMLRVYNYMGAGLAVTGVVAYLAADSGLYASIASTPWIWAVILAPLAFVLVLSFGMERISFGTAQLLFWGFSATMGLSLASVFLVFTGASIARVFFITGATFGAMSLYGYTTKADLSRIGSFLFMGLIGIIIASVVNIFVGSSALQFAVSIIGVIIFIGLTAWDTQQIKDGYLADETEDAVGKKAIFGALQLYLDFINLFTLLLQLFGQRDK